MRASHLRPTCLAAAVAIVLAAHAPAAGPAGDSKPGPSPSPAVAAAFRPAEPPGVVARGGEKLAWFIWGRRGKSRKVTSRAVSWPANRSWPTDAASVNRWGKILLAASEAPEPAEAADVLIVPRGEMSLALDGVLSATEWKLDQAARVKTGAGPLMVLGRWQDEGLAIAAGLPWVPALSPRTEAVLVLGPQPSDARGLPASARAYKVAWDARRRLAALSVAVPAGGRWRWRPVSPEDMTLRTGFRGGISDLGDGGIPFVAVEFLIPLTGPLAPANGARELTGALFIRYLPVRASSRDAIMWPPAHAPATALNDSLLLEHPDGWGRLATDEKVAHRGDLILGRLASAPRLDGAVSEDEWKGAGTAPVSFPNVATAHVWVGLAGSKLYLAIRCRAERQKLAAPALELLIDPAGDGGLLPRSDDRAVVLTARGQRGEVLSWHMPPELAGQRVVTSEGQWNRRESINVRWAWKIESGTVSAEVVLPLAVLDLDPTSLPPAMGLLVRLSYDAAFEMGR